MATGFQVRCKSCPREIAHPPDSVGSSVQTWQSIGPGSFTGRSEQVELRNLSRNRDFNISHPGGKETHLRTTFHGICWVLQGVGGTTYYLYELAIFLSGFIAQVAPTAAFDHLKSLFPQSFWLIAVSWMNPLPQKSDLYLDWPPYYPPPSPTPPQATCICLKIIFR